MTESQDGDIIRAQQMKAVREHIPLDDAHPPRERPDLDPSSFEARRAAERGEVRYDVEQQDAILAANRKFAGDGQKGEASEAAFVADAAARGQGGGLARKGRSILGD